MAKKNFELQSSEKKILGKMISRLRSEKGLTLRKFAETVGIPPSNMTYIENGINAPTAEVYKRTINVLTPTPVELNKMDQLYAKIRKTPPPDVCDVLLHNKELGEKIKILDNLKLSSDQIESIGTLFATFKN